MSTNSKTSKKRVIVPAESKENGLEKARNEKSAIKKNLQNTMKEILTSADSISKIKTCFPHDAERLDKVVNAAIDQFISDKWISLAVSRSLRVVRTKKQLIADLISGKDVDAPDDVKKAAEALKAFLQ